MFSLISDWQNGGFGIYIHWPFCQSKCPYCDFNSHVRKTIDHQEWKNALIKELQHASQMVPGRVVNSIFFGGGTPSLMSPDTVHALINEVTKIWPTSNDIEITLEANPTSVEAPKFKQFASAGVNRVSLGVQALNNEDLKRLGRKHDVKEALQAIDIAKLNFNRVSFDLIYARQNQSLKSWENELKSALEFSIDHLSLYQLTIENGTRFAELYNRNKLTGLPDENLAAELYLATQEICQTAGLPAYEISNHAKLGAESKHNMIYWRYGDYLGVGPGAHGRITVNNNKVSTETPLFPEKWLSQVNKDGYAYKVSDTLTKHDQAEEYLMVSLRLAEGCDTERYQSLSDKPINPNKLDTLLKTSLLTKKGHMLIATDNGKLVLNAIIRELLT